jgi:anti-sigma factor RsiW
MGMMRVGRNHGYTHDNLSAYLDGELSERERQRVERHLAQCAACRDELASLRATVTLLRQAPRQPLPRSFVLPPSAQLQQRNYQRWNWAFGALRSASVVVTLLLVILVSGDVLLGRGIVPWMDNRKAASPMALSEEAAPLPRAALAPEAGAAELETAADAPAAYAAVPESAPAPMALAQEALTQEAETNAQTSEPEVGVQALQEAPVALVPVEPESRPAAKGGEGMGMGGGQDVGGGAGGGAPPMPQTSGARGQDRVQPIPTVVEIAPTPEPTAIVAPTAVVEPTTVAIAPAAPPAPAAELALAPTQAPGPTPEARLAMQPPQAEPGSAVPEREVTLQEPPSEVPQRLYGLWAAVRRAAVAFFGLLLMLLAALLVISQRRRI